MGYDLYITRSRNWRDKTDAISVEEWRRIVESDPDLEPCFATESGSESFDPAVPYQLKEFRGSHCFYLCDSTGTITISLAHTEVIRKGLDIAKQLGAVVQGDEGEYYLPGLDVFETTRDRPDPDVLEG